MVDKGYRRENMQDRKKSEKNELQSAIDKAGKFFPEKEKEEIVTSLLEKWADQYHQNHLKNSPKLLKKVGLNLSLKAL